MNQKVALKPSIGIEDGHRHADEGSNVVQQFTGQLVETLEDIRSATREGRAVDLTVLEVDGRAPPRVLGSNVFGSSEHSFESPRPDPRAEVLEACRHPAPVKRVQDEDDPVGKRVLRFLSIL